MAGWRGGMKMMGVFETLCFFLKGDGGKVRWDGWMEMEGVCKGQSRALFLPMRL